MDSNDIGKKDQYQKRLYDRLIEGRRENQIMEMRLPLPDSSSTSRVSDNSREKDRQIVQLTHQLRESEESRQEVGQQLEHVRRETQQERNHQQRDIQEKNNELEDRNEQLRLKNIEIEQLQESTRELQESDNHQREIILKLEKNFQEVSQQLEHVRRELDETQRKKAHEIKESEEIIHGVCQQIENIQRENRNLQSRETQTNKELENKMEEIVQLTHQLRESEESRQKVSQRLEHVRTETQQERNQQQREAQERIRELEEQLHLRNEENQQKRQEIEQLRESDNRQRETILRLQRNYQDSQQAVRDTNIETPHWIIGREELQMTRQQLGDGAYGKVNIAIFRGTRVAAKSLHEVIISEYNLGVFTREIEISSRIHHPNIVQFLGATRVNNPILVYELMTTSLYKKIQEARLTQPQIVDVSSDITSALAYLHLWKPHPIIHRDVSSPNVLMEPSGNDRWRSKLSDFGSANLQSRVKTEIPGNPAYASPEAGIPDNHTPAMDIYSLGVVIMEMILHQPPEMTTISRERQAQSIQWRPMKVLVLRCINNDRTQRPKTVQVLDVLKQI